MSAIGDVHDVVRYSPGGLGPQTAWAGPGGPAPAAAGIGAGDVWRIIKQRKKAVAATLITLYSLVAIATVVVWYVAPQFESEGFMRFEPPVLNVMQGETPIVPRDYIEQQLQTESARIKQLDVLLRLLEQEEIKATEFYRWYGDHQKALYGLQDNLTAAPVRESRLIRVRLGAKNKKEATLIVDRLMKTYVSMYQTRSEDTSAETLATLQRTRDDVDRRLKELRTQITTLRNQRDMPAVEAERDRLADEIGVLSANKADFQARRADLDAQLEVIRGFDPRDLPVTAEMRVLIENDPVLRYYRQQVEALDIEIAVQKKRFGEKHRSLQELNDRHDEYFQKEVSYREQLTDDLRSRQVEQVRQESARIANVLGSLQEQLSEREASLRELDRAIQEFESLSKNEEMLQRELERVNNAVTDAEGRSALQKRRGQLTIASPPQDAVSPTRPNFLIYLGGGLLLSVVGALGVAFLLEFTDKAVRTPIDVARHGHISVLGSVPLLDEDETDIDEIETATRRAPHSLVSEAFRQIRAHLTFSGPAESQRTLLVTSPGPGDGKTAVAINLAVTLAHSNQRVLLIDMNFRRPALRAAYPEARAEGLSNLLVGRARFEDVISRTDIPNLDIITSGPMPPTPAELLGSKQMHELIEQAKAKYDRIIFDGPPCLLISDPLIVARQVDGVIVVVRAVSNSKGVLRRTREQLDRIGARVVGAVLNGVTARPGGYFRAQYREFYDYTTEETVPRDVPGIPAPKEEPEEFTGEKADRP